MIPRTVLTSRTFLRYSIGNFIQRLPVALQTEQKRCFNVDQILGVHKLTQLINQTQQQFGDRKETFLNEVERQLSNKNNVIHEEDLKNLLYLTRKNDKDIDLLKRAIDHFIRNRATKRVPKPRFTFGPQILRMATYLNEPSFALLPMQSGYKMFFDQTNTAYLALNLLYTNGMYEEAMELYMFMIKNFTRNFNFTDCSLISDMFFASAYQLNTPEAFDQCIQAYRQLKKDGVNLHWNSLIFFLAHALKQNRPKTVMEFIQVHDTDNRGKSYILQFKLRALADLAEYDRLIGIANSIMTSSEEKLRIHDESKPKREFFKIFTMDTLNYVEQKIVKSEQPAQIMAFEMMKENLISKGFIDYQRSIEKLLTFLEDARYFVKNQGSKPKKNDESDSDQRNVTRKDWIDYNEVEKKITKPGSHNLKISGERQAEVNDKVQESTVSKVVQN